MLDPAADCDQTVAVEAVIARVGALSTSTRGMYFKVTLEVRWQGVAACGH